MATRDLQTQLDEITQQTRALVQPERLASTDNFVQELFSSGLEERTLSMGSVAPAFALPDALTGKLVSSEDLLAVAPLIITFFRGRWCPYCITELDAWQSRYAEVRRQGALLVAISPQLPRQNDFTVQQHGLTFPVLSDAAGTVAQAFGLTYTVPPAMQQHFRSILVNIPFINGDSSWQLPLPGTFAVDRDHRILFAQAHADHRVRPDPDAVLEALAASVKSH